MKYLPRMLFAALLLANFAGCGGGGGGGGPPPPPASPSSTWDELEWDEGQWG